MTKWSAVYDEFSKARDELGTGLFYRGHRDAAWSLSPTIARCRPTTEARLSFSSAEKRESYVYKTFLIEAGDLLPPNTNSWTVAFAMQHHGLPTRLLDWTTTFAVALYFALSGAASDAAVWILDPYPLNQIAMGHPDLFDTHELPGTYEDYFITGRQTLGGPVVAVRPPRHHPRIQHQRGGFTLHADLRMRLQEIAPKAIRKVMIPRSAHAGGWRFLEAAGISEFSLFPDLDGLARDLKERYY